MTNVPLKIATLESLLAYHQMRLEKYLKSEIFSLLKPKILEDQNKKNLFLACLQVWSRYFQRIMHMRQAVSDLEPYRSLFLEHFKEEFGHDLLLEKNSDQTIKVEDTIIEAISSWFLNKMLTTSDI